MILFPNAKINLGLNICRKRPDGYHDIESVMVPIGWSDVLEIVPAPEGSPTTLSVTGRRVDCPVEKNLVMKAFTAMAREFPGMPQASVYLRKIVPDGAGLGGGSSDAAFTLIGLNSVFNLGASPEKLAAIAAGLGADCPFFIYNRPMLATGTGTSLEPYPLDLNGLFIAVAKPEGASVSTAAAYAGVRPAVAYPPVSEAAAMTIDRWQDMLRNDFEPTVASAVPQIIDIKEHFVRCGAVYASMSGSGSAVYGLFATAKMADAALKGLDGCACFSGPMVQ
ncbi:MAG: 4-(cytidine 5'-diphospho)-2-C-methyl-D-erythritol kinase [Muribaculaceae bacterium]|nr:4-(cytidine 5'-diphospho)-2-C-methyl-D-erythritol kinase [Muribaculaceae bacterium]